MVIAVLQFELHIPQSQSLKDKRRVVRSVKDRLHRDHMVSVAEVGGQELLTVAVMGLSLVSEGGRHASTVLDRIEAKLRTLRDAELGDTQRDFIAGHDAGLGQSSVAFDDTIDPVWTAEELDAIGSELADDDLLGGGSEDRHE